MASRSRPSTLMTFLALCSPGLAMAETPKAGPDLAGYKTVDSAVTATITRGAALPASSESAPAYLGVSSTRTRSGTWSSPTSTPTPRRPRRGPAGRRAQEARRPGDQGHGRGPGGPPRQVRRRVGRRRGLARGQDGQRPGDPDPLEPGHPPPGPVPLGPRRPGRGLEGRRRAGDRGGLLGLGRRQGEAQGRRGPAQGRRRRPDRPRPALRPDRLQAPGSTVVATLKLAEKAVDLKIKLDAPRSPPKAAPMGANGAGGAATGSSRRSSWRSSASSTPTSSTTRRSPTRPGRGPLQRGVVHQDQRHRPGRHGSFRDYFLEPVLRLLQGRRQGLSTGSRSRRSGTSMPPATGWPCSTRGSISSWSATGRTLSRTSTASSSSTPAPGTRGLGAAFTGRIARRFATAARTGPTSSSMRVASGCKGSAVL